MDGGKGQLRREALARRRALTAERLGAAADALVVVPGLGVDRTGTRLGRGGGSYDRALVRTRGCAVAALHAGELHDHLPAEPHDRPVDAAVLPGQGLVRLGPDPLDRTPGAPGGMGT